MVANILIIDDQPFFNELISFDLSSAGNHVSCVDNAKDAMTSIRSDNHDVVLLDLFLSGYERWDLLHQLKLQDHRRPILIVTTDEEIVNDPRLAEANGFVIKDIYADKVIKRLKTY